MCSTRSGFFLLLLLGHTLTINGLRNFDVRFYNFTYEVSSPKVESCNFELIESDGILGLNGYIIMKQPGDKLLMHLIINIIRVDNKIYRVLEFPLDLCENLREVQRSNYALFIYKELMKYSHSPITCLLLPHQNYTMERFHLDAELFPPYTPEVTFNARVDWYFGEEFAGYCVLVGRIESKRKKSLTVKERI